MKNNIFIIFILFLTSFSIEKPEFCIGEYKCIDTTISYNRGICEHFDMEKEILYYRACPVGYECMQKVKEEGAIQVYACQLKYQYKKEGSSCFFPEECESDNCKDNKCTAKVIGEECKSDLHCAKDAYCNNGRCKLSGRDGDDCDSNNGCLAGYECGQREENATRKVCIADYSIPSGKYASNERLCDSQRLDDKTHLCYDIESKNPEGTYCETNQDCKGTKIVGETKTETDLYCVCTWDLKGVCDYGTKSERWKSYISYYKTEMQKKQVSYSRAIIPVEEIVFTSDWDINNYYIKNEPLLYNAPQCLNEALNYADSPNRPKSSNSKWIKLSWAFLLGIILLIR